MAANCDYCHKPLGLVRRLRGEKFCSVEHLDLYAAQQAEIALERLAASVEERPILNEPLKVPRVTSPAWAASQGGEDEPAVAQDAVDVAEMPASEEMLDRLREFAAPAETSKVEALKRVEPAPVEYPMAGFLEQHDPELHIAPRPPLQAATLQVPAEGWGEAGRAWQLPAFQHQPLNPRDWTEPELLSQVPPAAAWMERRPVAPSAPLAGPLPGPQLLPAGTPNVVPERVLRPVPPAQPAPPSFSAQPPRRGVASNLEPEAAVTAPAMELPVMDGRPLPAGLGAEPLAATHRLTVIPPAGASLAETVAWQASGSTTSLPVPLAVFPNTNRAALKAWPLRPALETHGTTAGSLPAASPVDTACGHAWPKLGMDLAAGNVVPASVAARAVRTQAGPMNVSADLSGNASAGFVIRMMPVPCQPVRATGAPAAARFGLRPADRAAVTAVSPAEWSGEAPELRWGAMPRPVLESERFGKLRGRLAARGVCAIEPARAAAPLRLSPATLTVFPYPGFVLLPLALASDVRFAFHNPLPAGAPAALAQAGHRSGGPYPKLPRRLPDQYLRFQAPRLPGPYEDVPLVAQAPRRAAAAPPPSDGLTPTRLYAANYFQWPAAAFPAPLVQLRSEGLQRFARSADDVPRAVA